MKYYHKTYARDPYWTDARFRSVCKCGQVIYKGDRIFYYPATKTALCPKCSEKASNEFAAAVQDEDFYNSQY
jgi:hypothetical protein